MLFKHSLRIIKYEKIEKHKIFIEIGVKIFLTKILKKSYSIQKSSFLSFFMDI